MPTTASPRSSRRRATCMPMKPAAPVNRTGVTTRLALRNAQENRQRTIDVRHAAFVDTAYDASHLLPSDRVDLVDHDLRRQPESGAFVGRQVEAECGRIPQVTGDRKNGQRRVLVEQIRLEDDGRTRLSAV